MTDKDFLRRCVGRLSRHTFTAFITELFSRDSNYEALTPLPGAGDDVFCQPCLDSYGASIHGVLLLHFPPLELFRPSEPFRVDDPTLIRRLSKVKAMYRGRKGQWGMVSPFLKVDHALNSIKFVTSLSGLERRIYERVLIPAYTARSGRAGFVGPQCSWVAATHLWI